MRGPTPTILAGALAIIAASFAPHGPALAQSGATVTDAGRSAGDQFGFQPRPSAILVSARSFLPIAPDAGVTVTPRDDSDLNLQVRDAIRDGLVRRHRTIGPGLVLRFSTSEDAVIDGGQSAPVGQAYAVSDGESEVVAKLFSTSQDSLIGGLARNAASRVDPRWRIRATLDDPKTGQRLWDATVVGTEATGEAAARLLALVDPLLDSFGRTVAGTPIPVAGSVGDGHLDPNYLPIPIARGIGSSNAAPNPILPTGLTPVAH